MRKMDKILNTLLIVELSLALLVGCRMVHRIGYDSDGYTYHTTDSKILLSTEYDIHWSKGNVTYEGIPTFKDAVKLMVRDGII